MRILVTGAGGFIGSHLARTLAARGHEVVALLHSPAGALDLGSNVQKIVGDVTRRASFEAAARDCDAIAHLALPDVQTPYREAYPIWTEGTRNLLAVAVERRMRGFVIASGAICTYRHEPGAWVDETFPVELTTRLTRGRGEAVAMTRQASADHGLPVAMMRPPFVYGRTGSFAKYFLDYMRRGRYRVIGDGSNLTGFVHVDDCALAYALALEQASGCEDYIVADDTPLTLREASDLVADALRVPRPGRVPPFLARLVVGRDAVGLITESVRLRNAKLKTKLGWRPRFPSLREGLPSVVA